MKKLKKMKKYFCVLTPEEIKNAYRYQKDNNDWTFYQEREFVETLCQHRFNYLVLIYTLFVGVFFEVKPEYKLIVLISGAVMILLLGLMLYRAYVKLIIVLRILYALGPEHASNIIQKEVKAKGWKGLCQVNTLMGLIIPGLMFISFIAGIIATYNGVWDQQPTTPP